MVMRLCAVVTDLCPSLSPPHTLFLYTHRNHHHMRIDMQQPQIRLGCQVKQQHWKIIRKLTGALREGEGAYKQPLYIYIIIIID